MAYDDNLNINVRIDQLGVESSMNTMKENVRCGMEAVNGLFSGGMDWLGKLKTSAIDD